MLCSFSIVFPPEEVETCLNLEITSHKRLKPIKIQIVVVLFNCNVILAKKHGKPIFHEQARLGESDWRKLATGSQFNRIVISASTWTTGHYCKKVKR